MMKTTIAIVPNDMIFASEDRLELLTRPRLKTSAGSHFATIDLRYMAGLDGEAR